MSRDDLREILHDSGQDAVLASWVMVLDSYSAGAHCDVPPYEHWEALQELFLSNLLSASQFDAINVKQEFFSGRRPHRIDIQNVLDSIELRREPNITEKYMSKADMPIEAFTNTSSLIKRESHSELSRATEVSHLRPRRAPSALTAFSPSKKELSNKAENRVAQARNELASLECNRDIDAGAYVGGLEINGHIMCCGKPLKTMEESGDIISPEDLPSSGEYALLEYMFHAECKNCKSVYHVTCGKPIPRDDY